MTGCGRWTRLTKPATFARCSKCCRYLTGWPRNFAISSWPGGFLFRLSARPAPTAAQEEADPDKADSFYTRAGTWLRENTRDQKTFDVLFNENITYGYRRNLFALKWPALILNATIVVGCAVAYWYELPQRYQLGIMPVFIIAFLHAVYLGIFSSEEAVREAARTYARQLLLSTESPHLATSTAAKPRVKKQLHG
jgi:hypothetical protein